MAAGGHDLRQRLLPALRVQQSGAAGAQDSDSDSEVSHWRRSPRHCCVTNIKAKGDNPGNCDPEPVNRWETATACMGHNNDYYASNCS